MTKKELQRQIDDLRDRISMLENKNYWAQSAWTQATPWGTYQPMVQPTSTGDRSWTQPTPWVTYPPRVQPTSTGDPLPFPGSTTTCTT